jgi:hypothetical protein
VIGVQNFGPIPMAHLCRHGGEDVLPAVHVTRVGLAHGIGKEARDPERSEIRDRRSAENGSGCRVLQGFNG